MKFYRADSYSIAAEMASKDIENWSEEDRCKLQEIAKAKGKARLSYFGCYLFFIIQKECFMFYISKSDNGVSIKKLPFDPLNQLNDEQIVHELARRERKIIIDKYLSCNNVIENGVIKDSINDSDVQDILLKSTEVQLLNALYERKYGKCDGSYFFLAR